MIKYFQNRDSDRIDTALFVAVIVLYLIMSAIHLNLAVAILGAPLLFYYPGKFLLKFLPAFSLNWGKIGKFSLSIFYSFFLSCILGYVSQKSFGFNSNMQIWAIILLNLIFFVLSLLLPRNGFWQSRSWLNIGRQKDKYIFDRYDLLTLAIFATAVLIPILVSPLAQNADNYLIFLKNSVLSNHFQSNSRELISNSRPLFISFLALTGRFLMVDLAFAFRNLFVVLFFLFSLTFYDYCRNNFASRFLASAVYLSLLSPSVILTEINIIRPQVVMLSLTVPIMLLAVESVKIKKVFPSIIALAATTVSLKFHELSIVLVLISLVAFLINIYRIIFVEKRISWKYLLLFLIIVYPYFRLFNLGGVFIQTFTMVKYATHFLTGITWRWWFINNYTTIDGSNLGWSGISAFFYYLYNGFLLLLLLCYLFYQKIRHKVKTGLVLLPAAIYFMIFFLFAEILPRIGLYFLPNRALVHLMFATIVILALYFEYLGKKGVKIKYINIVLAGLIAMGFAGSIYVAKNNVDQVFREELPVAKYIKDSTPPDAIIISSQDNLTLVDIYGDRNFGRIMPSGEINKEKFDTLIGDELIVLSQDQVVIIKPKQIQTTETFENELLVKKESEMLQDQVAETVKAAYSGNNPVYFLYSYRKLGGLNSRREYKKEIIDPSNRDTYNKLGYPVVYSDKNVTLLKIR